MNNQLIALRCTDEQLRRLDELSRALGLGGNRSATIKHLITAASTNITFNNANCHAEVESKPRVSVGTLNANTRSATVLADSATGVGR